MFNHRTSRPFTSALLDAIDQGTINKDSLITDLLGYLSEAEVEDFVRKNDLLEAVGMKEEEDYDDSMDGDFDSAMASAGWGTDEDYGGCDERY